MDEGRWKMGEVDPRGYTVDTDELPPGLSVLENKGLIGFTLPSITF